ncbi:hypothetical protein [Roseisolibacter sp. H3M3-2]|uniref:hypothetical protein n=1 Tax=Roseisolibacter sp. H3M3-2 TaxID=3031323 RepID=UPI0023DC5024|nr:hypothetical protein [Roseisolibacter sp. H3M3-2]MDF1506282.1 hypothetical protein [Roseisolibacter sp. H3M3-2]
MTTALVRTHDSARDAAVDRFLARLGALGPVGWGRLDAIAEREAPLIAGLPSLAGLRRGVAIGRAMLDDAPDARRLDGHLRSLADLHAAHPGARAETLALLAAALLALRVRDRLPADEFARLYEPLARVLPLAAVDP